MADREQIISVLNDLIRTCRESHDAFERAADNVHRGDLKAPLNELSHQRAVFASELEDEVRKLGGEPASRPGFGSILQRGLDEIASRFQSQNDPEILAECQNIEENTRTQYQHALNEDLPADVRMVVRRQFQAVQTALSELRTLEIARGA